MKKILILCWILVCSLGILASCAAPVTPACQHRDANDDGLCDKCNAAYTDGAELPPATCEHRDANDDAFCDNCGEAYEDGAELPPTTCEHRDANDDAFCDNCGEVYEDGKDIPDAPVCQHKDADDNGQCDECGADFEDGKDVPDVPVENHGDSDKDHACDCGCGLAYGTHGDLDKDHVCDYGCTEVIGTHDDLDKDHVCDYGCAASIGECIDADKNHACDYGCAKTFGMHIDENKDHACDWGCDIIFGEHADADKNHTCDYGCSEPIGAHADTDMDRACDYCGAETDHTCVDNDLNHWCDYGCTDSYFGACVDRNDDYTCDYGCGRRFHYDRDLDSNCDCGCGEHFCQDEDPRDHVCDFCGDHLSGHHFNELSHFCDYCGDRVTECYDVEPADHHCDLCGLYFGECYDGWITDHFCEVCGVRISECYDENGDHNCDVCSAFLTECFDDDIDHFCDLCFDRMSECINEIFDHECDICGAILIMDCIDETLDHYCDYGCGKKISSCEDLYPRDHECDICGTYLGIHEDRFLNGEYDDFGNPINLKDHKCDYGCDKPLSICEDKNCDHYCDAYGKECGNVLFGICEDADEDGYCDYGCGKQFEIEADAPLYTRDGDYIYFGEYPQTIKSDNVTITDKQDSRGYFRGSDGCYYAKIVANIAGSGYTFSNSAEVVQGDTYYFKVEPIRWKILSESNGVALILCDSIIDNGEFDDYNGSESNNYRSSDIRVWLNVQFYETAFNELQRELIVTTLVDNSLASTGYKNNPYTCENTEDKIFLFSYADMTNSAYGFNTISYATDVARRRLTSDYVRAHGGWMSLESKTYGYGKWWLRTPYYNYLRYERGILETGEIFGDNLIYSSNYGIVPALRVLIGEHDVHPDENKDHRCDGCYARLSACVDDNSDLICDVCAKSFTYIRCDRNGNADPNGSYVLFGEYPQTIKEENVTITDVQDSRGYFLGSDGCYYAMVEAKPYSAGYRFSSNIMVTKGTVYYFKVEPIRWRILSEDGEKALILCDSIIANMAYDAGNSNNYADSDVRAWLNAQFYETAFSDLQQQIILTTTVDNGVESTGATGNAYVCEDTEDKVFLLSVADVTNTEYGFPASTATRDRSRWMFTSDYARAMGVGVSTDGLNNSYGTGWWWLRSPNNSKNGVRRVYGDGLVNYYTANTASHGVVPALWIRL